MTCAVLPFRDHALETGVVQRVVLHHDGQALVLGVIGGALGDGPRLEDAAHFQTEVVVQAAGAVLLHHEREVFPLGRRLSRGRLGGLREVALALVFGESLGHPYPL
jgi:hypothetical protein